MKEKTLEENATAKWKVQKAWREWLPEQFVPITMSTLTFDTYKKVPHLTVDSSWGLFKRWVHEINRHVMGKNYKRKFKHSYFSYVVTGEYQIRGVIHYHVLVDNYIPYEFANSVWRRIAGYIKTKPIHNSEGSIRYVTKYITKSDITPVIWIVKNKVIIKTIDFNEKVQRYLDGVMPQEDHE